LIPESITTFFENEIPGKNYILILNSPNNPLGTVFSDLEYSALAIVCRKYNMPVFSDEIYSQINFSESYSPSISKYYPEKTIVFGGLSKVFSAGGYRLVYMVLPRELNELKNVYKSLFSETCS
jgi:aspartate/methionine/tyrosine aminotransferase